MTLPQDRIIVAEQLLRKLEEKLVIHTLQERVGRSIKDQFSHFYDLFKEYRPEGETVEEEDSGKVKKAAEFWQAHIYQKQLKKMCKTLGEEFNDKVNFDDLCSLVEKIKQEGDERLSQHQEQLKKINLLFAPQAKDYQTIDFNGLYSLLQQIAERERERAKFRRTFSPTFSPTLPKNKKEKELEAEIQELHNRNWELLKQNEELTKELDKKK